MERAVAAWLRRAVQCAAVVACGVMLASSARAQDAAQTRAFAQQHFERGLELYDAHEHAAALDAFETSFELVPSPNSRLYVARCLRELGRLPEAVVVFEEVVRSARIDAARERRYEETERAASAELGAIQDRVARVIVRVEGAPSDAATAVEAEGRTIPPGALGLPWPVSPGTLELVARAGDREARATIEIAAGEERAVVLTLREVASAPSLAIPEPEAEPEPAAQTTGDDADTWTALFVSSAAIAAAGWGTSIAFLVASDDLYAELVAACGAEPCPPERQGDVADGRLYDAVATAALVVGAVGTIAAIGFGIGWATTRRAATDRGGEPRATLRVGPTWLQLSGSF